MDTEKNFRTLQIKNKMAPIYKSKKRTKTLFAEVSQTLT